MKTYIKLLLFLCFLGSTLIAYSQINEWFQRNPVANNVHNGWGINITPLETLSVIPGEVERVRYMISWTNGQSSDHGQTLRGPTVSIPENAKNISFTLKGIHWHEYQYYHFDNNISDPFDYCRSDIDNCDPDEKAKMRLWDEFWNHPINFNIPLWVCHELDDIGNPTCPPATFAEILDYIDGKRYYDDLRYEEKNPILVARYEDAPQPEGYYPAWYQTFSIMRPSGYIWTWIMAVEVAFDIDLTEKEQFIPIRAELNWRCSKEWGWSGWYLEGCHSLADYRGSSWLPHSHEIEEWDFDEHGLYLNSDTCSVTRNLSQWYKLGADIDDSWYDYVRTFNLQANPAVTYIGFPTHEDGCDQAVARVGVKQVIINESPIAVNDHSTTTKNIPIYIDVLTNDSDPENEWLTLQSLAEQENGIFEIVDADSVSLSGASIIKSLSEASSEVTENSATENVSENTETTATGNVVETTETTNSGIINSETTESTPMENISENTEVAPVENIAETTENSATENISENTETTATGNVVETTETTNSGTINSETTESTPMENVSEIKEWVFEGDDSGTPPPEAIGADAGNSTHSGASHVAPPAKKKIVKFTPNKDFVGTATAKYTISDEQGNTAEAMIYVVIKDTSGDIIATPDTGKIPNDQENKIPLLPNDSYKGTPPTLTGVTIELIIDGGTPPTGTRIDDEWVLVIPPSTTEGIIELKYKICEKTFPDNCSEAPITIDLYTPTGSLSFKKVDKDNPDITLSGIIFGLFQNDEKKYEATADSQGLVSFTQIKPGKYILKEIATIAGYEHSIETREVEIVPRGSLNIPRFENKKIPTPTPTPTPQPPKPSTPSTPPSGSSGTPPTITPPKVPVTPGIPPVPFFSAPMVDGQCVSAVKNLDDPKLLAYYDVLQVMNRENLNRTITRAEFVKLVVNAGRVNPAEVADMSVLQNFSDININEWYAPYIAYIIQSGKMHGQEIIDENGNITKIFRPNDTISRAEASKILSELIRQEGENLPTLAEITSFSDVIASESLSPYIQYAYNNCLLHGRNTIDGQPIGGPRVFEGFDGITLAETSKILYNMTHSADGPKENFSIFQFIKNLKSTTESAVKIPETTQELVNSEKNIEKKSEEKAETTESKTPTPTRPAIMLPTLQVGNMQLNLQNLIQ